MPICAAGMLLARPEDPLLVERSAVMFTSVVGTWLPFALIFVTVAMAGALRGPSAGQSAGVHHALPRSS